MIAAVREVVVQRPRTAMGLGGGVLVVLVMAGLAVIGRTEESPSEEGGKGRQAKVEHVYSGCKVKLDADKGKGEELMYAGIRAPYAEEPLHEASKKRNAELVEGKKVWLRFDAEFTDPGGHGEAYVFAGGQFVNRRLVEEGLAYVRLTTDNTRFAKELLTAQATARKQKKGLWKGESVQRETSYAADPKYGNFHRPGCEEVAKIKPERLTTLSSRVEAFDRGLAPCAKCRP
ncbi:MAG: thermonuclease family protein [Planctomycetota bacterium]